MERVKSKLRYKDTEISLVVCKSCKWCVSNLSAFEILNCLNCDRQRILHIPISKNERYTINFDNDSINLKFFNFYLVNVALLGLSFLPTKKFITTTKMTVMAIPAKDIAAKTSVSKVMILFV